MFKRLLIQNFRSIGEANLELAPYSVIVGQNRAGKSNILRALRALFTNQTGDDFIRQGQTSCVVEVETEEGTTIRWEKTKAGATYTLKTPGEEDRVFTKLAGQVPQEIQDALGVRSVDVDATTNIWPQVHQQGEFAFLIKPHLTAGQAARAIARLTKLDVVVKAQTLCKSALRSLTATLKEEKNALQRSETELLEFQYLKEEKDFLDSVQEVRKTLVGKMRQYTNGMFALQQHDAAVEAAGLFIPNYEDLAEIEASLETLDAVSGLLDIIDKVDYVNIPEFVELKELLKKLDAGVCFCNELERNESSLDKIIHAYSLDEEEAARVRSQLEALTGTECPVCGGVL